MNQGRLKLADELGLRLGFVKTPFLYITHRNKRISKMKVFFSHATEDKPLVEQVFIRICEKYPEITGWLDKYEILGGDELIDKIHSGIESSDKFLVFLSSISIEKPWVKTELRKALADEISGIKPEFIIPIKVGPIPKFPPFLESRFYIDIEEKTEEEWMPDIYSAITRQKKNIDTQKNNINVLIQPLGNEPNGVVIVFESKFWAEVIGFKIKTTKKIVNHFWEYPEFRGVKLLSISEFKTENEYGIRIFDHNLKPKTKFAIGVIFEENGDPRSFISNVGPWNGDAGENKIVGMSFN